VDVPADLGLTWSHEVDSVDASMVKNECFDCQIDNGVTMPSVGIILAYTIEEERENYCTQSPLCHHHHLTLVKFFHASWCLQTTKGNRLKFHTLIWEHRRRSLSKAHNPIMDFDRIMALFELRNHYIIQIQFCYQAMSVVVHDDLLTALVIHLTILVRRTTCFEFAKFCFERLHQYS
jgi:hypothetical protein